MRSMKFNLELGETEICRVLSAIDKEGVYVKHFQDEIGIEFRFLANQEQRIGIVKHLSELHPTILEKMI